MDKIKEMLKNKKVLTGAVAGLAVVVILIIIIAVSCGKNDNSGKSTSGTSKTESATTTVKKAEKDTADEQNTTEPDTELSEEETMEGSTETAETETTEQPTADLAENITTNVNIQTEPVTDAPAPTEAPAINITAEVPSTEAPTPAPEEPATERTTEVATLAGCGNRECSNIIYLGDEININVDVPFKADVCPYKLYDLNNLQTRKYTNGNGYYVTFVGYYGLQYISDYNGSIDELEYNYVEQIVKSYGYNSVEDFEVEADKLKTNTAATRGILVGSYMDIPSTIDVEEASRAEFWASLGQEYDYEMEGGGIYFYGLYMLEY